MEFSEPTGETGYLFSIVHRDPGRPDLYVIEPKNGTLNPPEAGTAANRKLPLLNPPRALGPRLSVANVAAILARTRAQIWQERAPLVLFGRRPY